MPPRKEPPPQMNPILDPDRWDDDPPNPREQALTEWEAEKGHLLPAEQKAAERQRWAFRDGWDARDKSERVQLLVSSVAILFFAIGCALTWAASRHEVGRLERALQAARPGT